MMNKLRISTVTPVYAGAGYLKQLVEELRKLRDMWMAEDVPLFLMEAIFIDDAAKDDSPSLLDRLAAQHPWVKVIHLSRNFGQHPATVAGILHSSGDWIVTLDEDLQHPPARIPLLLRKVAEESFDIVYAHPEEAVHESYIRDLGSRLYKHLIAKLADNKSIVYFNSYRLMRGSVARAAASVCSHETYFDIVLSWFTNRVGFVVMPLKDDRVILGNKSGYSWRKLLSHARRMIVSTQTKVLRVGAFIGMLSMLASTVYGIYIVEAKLMHPESVDVRGWPSLFIAILFFGGIASFLIGVVLEYMSVILLHVQGKPTFFVVDRSSDNILSRYFGI